MSEYTGLPKGDMDSKSIDGGANPPRPANSSVSSKGRISGPEPEHRSSSLRTEARVNHE